jgi:hypothetical protein
MPVSIAAATAVVLKVIVAEIDPGPLAGMPSSALPLIPV